MRRVWIVIAACVVGCSAPIDERATEDGSVAHPRCESCHLGDFEEAVDPPHAGQIPTTCFVCHTQAAWRPAALAHDFYPLTGAHLEARCLDCHGALSDENEPRYEGRSGLCVSCHRKDYDLSDFPGHSRFPFTCGDCHSTSAWSPTLHPPPEAEGAHDAGQAHDAGTHHHHAPPVDAIGSASSQREWSPAPVDAGHDAGHHHTTHAPPPPTTTTRVRPPPTTTLEEPPPPPTTTTPDVVTRPSRGR